MNTPELTPVTCLSSPEHGDLVMVRDGRPVFTIVADLDAEARMQWRNRTDRSIGPALKILSVPVERCTGICPALADIRQTPASGNLQVMGDCVLACEQGIDVTRLPAQGFAVKTFSRGIILAGNDSSLVEGYNLKPLEGRGSSTGTKYDAYDFVERFLGVRYYFPGDYGTLWPKLSQLTIRPVHYTDAPYFDIRNGIFYLGLTLWNPTVRKYWEPYLGKTSQENSKFWDRWRMGGSIPLGGSHCPYPERIAKAIDAHWDAFYVPKAGKILRKFHRLLRTCYRKCALKGDPSQTGILYPLFELKKLEKLIADARKAVQPDSVEARRLKLILAPWPKAIAAAKNQLAYERPIYGAHQLLRTEVVTLDGRGGEDFWKRVKPMPLMDPRGGSDQLRFPASVKLAWNQQGIYGLFETAYGPLADKNKDLWQNDSYEVFFSPGLKGEVEYQFVFDPYDECAL